MVSTVQAYERAEFSLVEVYDRVRIYVISICPKGHADTLYGCEKSQENVLVLKFNNNLINFKAFKGM